MKVLLIAGIRHEDVKAHRHRDHAGDKVNVLLYRFRVIDHRLELFRGTAKESFGNDQGVVQEKVHPQAGNEAARQHKPYQQQKAGHFEHHLLLRPRRFWLV